MTWRGLSGVLCGAIAISAACVDNVQADPVPLPYWVVAKSAFNPEDEWWTQRTLVGAAADVGWTLVGDGDLGQTIRWRVEEFYVVAERSRAFVRLTDDDSQSPDAELIAAYPIFAHFDVVGGQIVTPPKKTWRDLPYMRVDWTQNLVDSLNFLGANIEADVAATFIDDPDDPNHPIFEDGYIDFTTREYASPLRTVDLLTGEDAACDVGEIFAYRDCTPAELLLRTSFRRLPRDHQFESIRASDADLPPQLSAHNVFTTSYLVLDPEYLLSDDSLVQNFNRHNLWRQSFREDGSPLPYRERTVKPIAFHIVGEWPEGFVEPVVAALAQWDRVLRDVVRDLRAYECTEDGGNLATCRAQHEVEEPVLLGCLHNPVREGDPAACGEPGTVARLGDMRFHTIEWVRHGTQVQPMGFTWWSTDFTTGELTNVHITLSEMMLRRNATNTVDAVLMARGDVGASELGFDPDIAPWFSTDVRPAPRIAAPARSTPRRGRLPADFDWDRAFAPLRDHPAAAPLRDEEDFAANGLQPDDLEPAAVSPLVQPYRKVRDVMMREGARARAHALDVDVPATIDVGVFLSDYADLSREELHHALMIELHSWSILHELGHGLGMRHNFAASYDALNYPDGYWGLRRTDCASRASCGYTQDEKDGDIERFTYSSVMDYLNRTRSGQAGLGHTDVAVIKALYGKLVPVFADPALSSDPDAVGLLDGYRRMGTLHAPVRVVEDATAETGLRARVYHYSEYPQVLGDLSAREYVPGSWVGPNATEDREGRLVVPRIACEDRELAQYAYCTQFDQGADPAEIVAAAADWYRYYLPINYFRRGRVAWKSVDTSAAVSNRTFLSMRRWHTQLQQTMGDLRVVDADFASEPGLVPLTQAAETSLRFLTSVLTMPLAGPHISSTLRYGVATYEPLATPASDIGLPAADSDIMVPPGAGLPLRSRLVETLQSYRLDNIGGLTDKELALEALFAPDDWTFQGATTQGAYATWRTNFYMSYPEELTRFLGAIIAGSAPAIAPRLLSSGQLEPQDPFADTPSTAGQAVDPALPFVARARALAFYVSLEGSGYLDQQLLNSVRILRIGTIDATVPPVAGSVDFTDPLGGFQYRADSYPYGPGSAEVGVGARILTRAQEIGDALALAAPGSAEQETLQEMLREQMLLVQVVRGVVDAYENVYELPDDPPPLDEEEEEAP
jgi:hypothetical protein